MHKKVLYYEIFNRCCLWEVVVDWVFEKQHEPDYRQIYIPQVYRQDAFLQVGRLALTRGK